MQTVIADILTTYRMSGKGNDILLIHGWGDSLQTYDGLSRDLAREYRVTALDLPGFGATEPPKDVWGLEEYAAFLADFTDKLRIRPYAVIAHSNGGAVAIKAAASGRLKPEKLVLLASSGIRDRQKFRRFLLKIIAKIGKVTTFWLPVRIKRKLQKKLYGVAGSDMHVVPHLQETFKRTVRQDVQADARRLNVPVLLVYGGDDRATPVLYGQIYNRLIQNSTLQILEGAGHFVHHDEPERVAGDIKEFLRG